MKITEINVYPIETPIEQEFYYSMGYVDKRASVIVEVVTDEGYVGYGESLCHGQQPVEASAAMIQYGYAPLIVGKDPFQRDIIWETLYNRSRPYGQGGIAVNALSGVDIALWDIVGKATGQPIYQLLGGAYRTEITPYATGFHRKEGLKYPEALIEEAHRHLDNGFRAMKMKAGFGVEDDIQTIKAVRDALPDDVRLMADFNGAYDLGSAKRIVHGLNEDSIFFLEELIPPEDLEGYAYLRSISHNYIAAGENIFTKIRYKDFFEKRALDIIQPDISSSGGFTELKKILALAQAYNTLMFPHVWGSGVSMAAALQFIAAVPPMPISIHPLEPMLEYDHAQHPFRLDIICNGIRLENGKVTVPSGPGLGVTVDKDILEHYRKKSAL